MIKFPDYFWWGAATSAYQVEGGNAMADWWPWETKVGHESSGHACGHFERYARDFDLVKELGHNAHRLSIEWSRVEPREGVFCDSAVAHYIDVMKALRARGIEPMVTLHHFTNPIWLSERGGWENPLCVEWFLRYSDFITRALAPHVGYWMTINEPTIYISHSYLYGWWPPQLKSWLKARVAHGHMIKAHIQVYGRIHQIYKELKRTRPFVSIAQHIPALVPCADTWKNRLAVFLRNKYLHFEFLDAAFGFKALDFIGLNYYSRQLVSVGRLGTRPLFLDAALEKFDPVAKNSLGWDIYPQGLYDVLLKLRKYDLPVMITENGICTLDDQARWEFIHAHLLSAHRAIEAGVNVIGYLYWSLMDNFEWDKGFSPRFGLIDIDYTSQARTVRESSRKYAQVCRTGVLE